MTDVAAAIGRALRGEDPLAVAASFDAVAYADDPAARKAKGAHFTPAEVAVALAEETLASIATDAPTVLDPACGGGALLLASLRVLARARPDLGAKELGARLLGVDVDARMVELARGLVRAELLRLRGEAADARIAVGDGLAVAEPVDVVVANPPWVSYAGREGKPLDPATRAAWFSDPVVSSWPTLHGLFLLRASRLARRRFGFVLPDQVGHLAKYGALRRAIEDAAAVSVTYLGEDRFDAITPSLTVVCDVEGPRRVVVDGRERPREGLWTASFAVAIARPSFSVGESLRDVGLRTEKTTRELLVPLGTRGAAPVLQGRDVTAWACSGPSLALLETEGGPLVKGNRETQRLASLVVRQTAAWPIVGPKRGAELFRNSLHALLDGSDELGVDVAYVAALLNAEPVRALYQGMVHESGQKVFPQVKVGQLRRLPLVRPTQAEHGRIVDLSRRRLAGDLDVEPALAAAVAALYAPP